MKKCAFSLFLFLSFFCCFSQQKQIDSLKQVLKTTKEDTTKVNALISLASLLQNFNPDTATLLFKEAITVSQHKIWLIGIIKSNNNLGRLIRQQGNYTEALVLFQNALASCEEAEKAPEYKNRLPDLRKLKAMALGNIGATYYGQSNYPLALQFFFKSTKIAEETNNKQVLVFTYGNTGAVYKEMKDFKKALEYYFKALEIAEELGNKSNVAAWLGNIGGVYYAKADYKQTLEYYLKALKISNEIGNTYLISSWLGNIGAVYYALSDFNNAIEFYTKALILAKETGNKQLEANNLCNIGAMYLKQKNYAQAESYTYQSLKLCSEIGNLETAKEDNLNLSILYEETHRYPKAMQYFKAYIINRDSLLNEENTKKTVKLEMNYEFEKKEAITAAENSRREAVAAAESKKQKIVIAAVSAGLILILILAIVILRSLRINQKKNRIISLQKEAVEKQKEIVEEHQKEILDSIRYARRIQTALLPTEKYIEKSFNRLRSNV